MRQKELIEKEVSELRHDGDASTASKCNVIVLIIIMIIR